MRSHESERSAVTECGYGVAARMVLYLAPPGGATFFTDSISLRIL